MKLLIILFVSILFCGGEERWDVKTLSDKDAGTINFVPKHATVAQLVSIPSFKAKGNTPRQALEKQTYVVTAKVVDYFKEADRDVHLVLQDLNNPSITMIAEIPDPTCGVAAASPHVGDFIKARSSFLGYASKRQVKGKIFTITGVAFIDIKHPTPQRGVAPNEIELHPVLNFTQ